MQNCARFEGRLVEPPASVRQGFLRSVGHLEYAEARSTLLCLPTVTAGRGAGHVKDVGYECYWYSGKLVQPSAGTCATRRGFGILSTFAHYKLRCSVIQHSSAYPVIQVLRVIEAVGTAR